MGDIPLELKDSKGALEYYRQALEISTALAEHDPTNMQAQFDLAVVLATGPRCSRATPISPPRCATTRRRPDTLDRLVKTDPGTSPGMRTWGRCWYVSARC